MGWTASYQILRERPLDDSELLVLDEFITRHNRPPWEGDRFGFLVTRVARADRVLGDGAQKLPMTTDESADLQRLCDVLNALPKVIEGIEVRIRDDFGSFGWDVDERRVTLQDDAGPVPVAIARDDHATWKPPAEWIPGRFRAMSPAMAAFAAGGGGTKPETLRVALVELANLPDERPARMALVARCKSVPPLELALAGLDAYGDIARAGSTWDLVLAALDTIFDVTPLVEPFLAVWRAPRGIYWYGDMRFPDRVLDSLARWPAVEAQMTEDLAASVGGGGVELVHRRAEHAAQMLGRARTATALATLLEAARALRGRTLPAGVKEYSQPGVYAGLAIAGVPAVVPSLLLEVGTARRATRHGREALPLLVRLAPARVAPFAAAVAAVSEGRSWPRLDASTEAALAAEEEALAAAVRAGDLTRLRAVDVMTPVGLAPDEPVRPPGAASTTSSASPVGRHVVARGAASSAASSPSSSSSVASSSSSAASAASVASPLSSVAPSSSSAGSSSSSLASVASSSSPSSVASSSSPASATSVSTPAPKAPVSPPATPGASGAAASAPASSALRRPLPGMPTSAPPAPPHAPPATAAPVASVPAPPSSASPARPPPATPPPVPTPSASPRPASPPPAPRSSAFSMTSTLNEPTQIETPEGALIDELLTILAREKPVSPELAAAAGLAPTVPSMDRWDRAKAVRARLLELGAAQVGVRLLDRLAELHDGSNLQQVCDVALPVIAGHPGVGARFAALWEDAHARPWESPHRITDYLEPVLGVPELVAAAIDELGAPDDGAQRSRTSSAFGLLARAKEHRDVATAVVVARLRVDRGRPRDVVGWRGDAYKALRKLGGPDAIPTAILELAEPSSPGKRPSELLELLTRGAHGPALLMQAIDLPELAGDATLALCRSGILGSDGRARYLAHPFWKVRLVAADSQRDYKLAKLETRAVWASIDAAGLTAVAQDRSHARPDAAAAAADARTITLPPLPPARDGLDAPCADHRAWALWAVDERLDPADAVARVFADELDRALVGLGHARVGPRWPRWRDKLPKLPHDRRGRLAWATAQRDAPLSPTLARVRDEGATAVALTLPPPFLVLTPALRDELLRAEEPIAARGLALFRDGLRP